MKTGKISEAKDALAACLGNVPFFRLNMLSPEVSLSGVEPALVVALETSNGLRTLLVEVKSNGQPKELRHAARQLRAYQAMVPNAYAVIAAPYISPAGAAVCEEEGVGYVDFAGNCRLCFDNIFVERMGAPNPHAGRFLKSLYMPKAERILRVMLVHPKRSWRTQALADEAKVSLGQVANVKKLLDEREWIEDTEGGIALTHPAVLLDEWVKHYDPRRNSTRQFYSLQSVHEIEGDLTERATMLGARGALSGFSGAARLAPHVRYQRGSAYVDSVAQDLLDLFKLKPVESGGNFSLIVPYDEGVYYGERAIKGANVLSPIQLYLDLRHIKGRGEEAAQVLLERVIEPTWQ
jgi:hypothetical protein